MNERVLRPVLICGLLFLAFGLFAQTASTNATASTNTPALSGKIEFAQPIYDFGKVKSGSVVNHTFIFTNTGSGTLNVTQVQPSCGCTAASEWTRKVEPGETGKIPVQFNSYSYSGQVLKTITVVSSASPRPTVLQLKGELWKPIDVNPQFAVINILPDVEGGSTTVRIINNTQEQLVFSEPEVSNKAFLASIEPSTNNPGKEYTLTIRTVPPLPQGNVQAQVTAKTGSTNLPVLTVTAWANVQPAFVVMPGQITLPAAPLQGPVTPSILVQNNSTNLLQITEPAVNAPDVKIDLRETQPGRQFSIALTFPKGYEVPSGEKIVFTAKSSNPSIPTIKVPVTQLPRALATPPPLQPQTRSVPAPPASPVAKH